MAFIPEPHSRPHTFIPVGCSGRVQVGAGECSNEHEAKHLSPSEADPQSFRVDRVHCVPSSAWKAALV